MSMLLGQVRQVAGRAIRRAAPGVIRGVARAAPGVIRGLARPGRAAGLQVLTTTKGRRATAGGQPILVAVGNRVVNLRRRRRGISPTELRGFKKVTGLLRSVGMRPAGLGQRRAAARPRRRPRRVGDPDFLPGEELLDDDELLD